MVSFKLGSITLGSSAGASLLTPLDLVTGAAVTDARVLNRLQLLQTLDSDKDVDNGIVIDPNMLAKLNDTAYSGERDRRFR
jgi:para-nitrobenzyl esterase